MKINYGNDKTEKLKKEGILKEEHELKTQNNMKQETSNSMIQPAPYHSFVKG